ncbi:hypothetical protein SSP35_04_04130 [Streptomyces sp. NBRC 110611]|uniref:hypothetical protein n=1 Tax=Streptomyces sp. NBRC 110611 TaxID=1621259 RepID=UPI00082D458B|nr:hypothetical protein [Streptomyces sp. NBRC 110611]GAU67325.1 hypothetical protein SSP35_04_04130 [Streptomyces sp. NBRC 110611]
MAEEFECDYDGGTRATVQADPDGYVEVEVQRLDDGHEPPAYLYLTPEAARRFARTIALASITAEGEQAPKMPTTATSDTFEPAPAPCPEGNGGCSAECAERSECHRAAVADLFRPVEPPARGGGRDREALFLAARGLAGPAAGLDDVLKVAAYLAA